MRPSSHAALAAIASLCLVAGASSAMAKVMIEVDLDTQVMHVTGDGESFTTKVSSGRAGHETPNGDYKLLWKDKEHHSDEYEDAYMPNALFFAPGFAIHGFSKSPWGHKASHGCIRVPYAASSKLWNMVEAEGIGRISIVGASDGVAPTVAEAEASTRARAARNARTEEAEYAPVPRRAPRATYAAPRYYDPNQDDYYAPAPTYGYGVPVYRDY